jgi:phosphoesterase RecJ-like protein
MQIYEAVVAAIKEAKSIVITAHKSPDGDSVGSSLGMYFFIKKLGYDATICHPDPTPEYLHFLNGVDKIYNYMDQPEVVKNKMNEADLIFSLDYNATNRIGEDMQLLLEQSSAKKIMIDHHLDPEDYPEIRISETSVCSTCQLVAEVILQSENEHLLDEQIGTPLYTGILTDTGSFRFSSVQPRTHEVVAKLLAAGVKHSIIHETLNDNSSVDRLRLQGYTLAEKMEYLEGNKVAIMSLTEDELNRFAHQKGDTEGLVNIGLSIKGAIASIFLSEKEGKVKISFRSKGTENPVNALASEHFYGGGHMNASGGVSELSMDETISKLKTLIPIYFPKR